MNKRILKLLSFLFGLPARVTRPITLGVMVLFVKERRVLLVKHTYQDLWYLVGGGVKRNETLEAAAMREAREEVGAKPVKLQFFGIYTSFNEGKSNHIVVFYCADFTLTGETDREIESFKFFEFDNLPKDISPGTKRRICEYLDKKRQPAASIW